MLATLAAGFHELGLASWMLYAFLTLVPSFNYVVFPCVQVRMQRGGRQVPDKFCEETLSLLLEMLAGPHLRRAEGSCLRFRLARMQAMPPREGTIHIKFHQTCLTLFTPPLSTYSGNGPPPSHSFTALLRIYGFKIVICE